ncbi:MAG: cytidylate kinase-like family protein [Elusimicrobia bacterium]|nr:cytidylate kinase-like family protein [Elusimicrobiota bacterium]
MADPINVVRFLDTMGKNLTHDAPPQDRKVMRPFITISREPGAGGHSLAEALLAEFRRRPETDELQGWGVFDQKLCETVAQDPKLRVSMQSLIREEYRGELADYISQAVAGTSAQSTVLAKVFETVRSLAWLGKVVIVGRAAACATRGFSHGIHVRLIAGREHRVRRMMGSLRADRREAERIMREQEDFRAALVRDYFQRDIADPHLYDCVWNVEKVPLERVSRVLADMVTELADDHRLAKQEAEPVS